MFFSLPGSRDSGGGGGGGREGGGRGGGGVRATDEENLALAISGLITNPQEE